MPIVSEPEVNEYLSLVMTLLLAFGVAFQLPVLLTLMARAGLITSQYFFGTRHYEESATVYNSQWAEVVYFLRPTGDTAKGTPLFALYRRQFLLVLDTGLLAAPIAGTLALRSFFPHHASKQLVEI